MKNNIKRLLAALLTAGLCLTASACQLSEIIGKDTTPADTSGDTTPADSTSDAPSYDSSAEAMDFSEVDVLKYVKLGQYKGISATLDVKEVTDEDVETELKNIVDNNGVYEQITDRACAKGDTVNIDFKGFLDGVQFSGGTAEGQTITLSDTSGYIDGFADGIIGAEPGKTVTLNLTFPDPYPNNTDYSGKAVTFEVKVNYIQGEYIEAELNDEFVVRYTGGDISTVDELRTAIRKTLVENSEKAAKESALASIWEQVMDNAEVIEYPEQQIEYYFAMQMSQCEYYAKSYGMTVETIMQLMGYTEESFRAEAQKYTKEDLVFFAVVQTEGVTISDGEYTAGLAKYAADAGAGATPEALEDYYGKKYITEALLWDKLLDMIYEMSDVK